MLVAALALSACTTSAQLTAVGQPSLSLAAPLSVVACTTTGACVSAGASGSSMPPSAVGQVRNLRGAWSALAVPDAPVAAISTASCASQHCLVGGTQSGGELLWSIDAGNGAVTAESGAAAGVAVLALSCASDADCAMVDQTPNDLLRFSTSGDGGQSWGSPRTLAWAAQSLVVLDCPAPRRCLVAASAHGHVDLRQSIDAGVTWQPLAVPSTWTSVIGLHCASTCVALVSEASGSAIATRSTTGSTSTWTSTSLPFSGAALACTPRDHCLVVGQRDDASAAMSSWNGALHSVALTYVPSPLAGAACGPSVCVAVGVSTTVAFTP